MGRRPVTIIGCLSLLMLFSSGCVVFEFHDYLRPEEIDEVWDDIQSEYDSTGYRTEESQKNLEKKVSKVMDLFRHTVVKRMDSYVSLLLFCIYVERYDLALRMLATFAAKPGTTQMLNFHFAWANVSRWFSWHYMMEGEKFTNAPPELLHSLAKLFDISSDSKLKNTFDTCIRCFKLAKTFYQALINSGKCSKEQVEEIREKISIIRDKVKRLKEFASSQGWSVPRYWR